MSLTRKSILIVFTALLCLLAVMYFTAQTVVLHSFEELEQEKLLENTDRGINLFRRQAKQLESTAGDWSCWDDTYVFLQGKGPEFAENNLMEETFSNLDLDFMHFYDPQGNLFHGNGFDSKTGEKTKPDLWFTNLKSGAGFILDHPTEASKKSGIVQTPKGLAVISSRPVLTSNEEGPATGTLVMGRYLTPAILERLSGQFHIRLTLLPFDSRDLPMDFQEAKEKLLLPETRGYFQTQADADTLSGYVILPGLNKNPAALMRINQPQDILNQGRLTTGYFIGLLAIEGLLFSGLILVLIRIGVLSRLFNLKQQVDRIGRRGELSRRVDVMGKDEISHLSTAVNQMLDALEKSENRYRLLAENASDVILILSLSGMKPEYISPSIEQLTGYTVEEALNLDPARVFAPHSLDRFRSVLAREKARENEPGADPHRSRIIEMEIVPKSGSSIWTEFRLSFLRNREGVPNAILGIVRDISERKRVEEDLVLHSFLLNQSKEYILAADLEGRIIYANAGLASLLGKQPEQIVGQAMEVFPAEPGESPSQTEIFQKTADQGHWFGERQMRLPDGSNIWVELVTQMTVDDTGKPKAIFSVGRDITSRKEAEKEKENLEEQLRQSQKLEAVGRLAGGVAHDFNNILTGVIGFAEMILSEMHEENPLYPDLQEILKAGERAAALTEQLLAFGRKQIIAPKVIQINEIIRQSEKMLVRIIGEDIEFSFQPQEPLWHTKIDPVQIDQILMNLAANARDAMPGGGRLTVETANIHLEAGALKEKPEATPGDYVRLLVSDTGMGMDKEIREHIFEPFYSTKARHKGAGLGMATVYGIVKQNNGLINVYSEPGMGSAFKIYFPKADAGIAKMPEEKTEPATGGSESILLVEDETMVRGLARRILTGKGYRIIEPSDIDEALRLSRQPDLNIDLLLTDVIMPKMNGREVMEAIRAHRPDLKVLFMSGYPESVIAHHGVLSADHPFIQKPFSIESLSGMVRRVLDGRA